MNKSIANSLIGIHFLLIFISCKSNNPTLLYSEDNYIFFTQNIEPLNKIPDSEYYFIFTINTSFCGSCTEKTLAYIHNSIFDQFSKTYITDINEGNIVEKIKVIPNSNQMIISIDDQERAGIFSTYNKIYIINKKEIIYSNYLIDSNIKDVTKFIEQL